MHFDRSAYHWGKCIIIYLWLINIKTENKVKIVFYHKTHHFLFSPQKLVRFILLYMYFITNKNFLLAFLSFAKNLDLTNHCHELSHI